ncbi:hypothetical protein MAR_003321, partial [Mya arenaria]
VRILIIIRRSSRIRECAAVSERPLLYGNNNQFVQFICDSDDHTSCNIDGHNRFHGRRIIATVTTNRDHKRVVPLDVFSRQDLIKLGKISIIFLDATLEWGCYRHDENVFPLKCDFSWAPNRLLGVIR